MMRGLVVAGPRPSQGVAAQIKNADIEDASRLGVELLARLASGLGQRRLTHRNPDLRVTSIDQPGAPIPAVRGTEIERAGFDPKRSLVPSHGFGRCCPVLVIERAARRGAHSGHWSNTRWAAFDDTEGGRAGRERHVVGHYRLS